MGLNIAMGTDTSPPDMVMNLQLGMVLARAMAGSTTAVRAEDYYDAATIGGADALRRPDLGRLQPGARADIAVFDLDRPHSGQVIDPVQTMMLTGHGRDFSTVVIDGRFVMEDRVIPGIDEAADNVRAQRQFEGVMARYPERTLDHPPMNEIFSSSYPIERKRSSPHERCRRFLVRDLRIVFDGRHGPLTALDGVSFDIAPGEILGVVGESGAGKSLTGTAVIGLLDPPGRIAGGSIHLDGQRIDNLPAEAMRKLRGRRIGAIFQDPLTSLHPLLTVGEQLVETITTHLPVGRAEARARALQLLKEVGIPGRRDAGSTSIRTSSPAACASASSSRSRSARSRA